MHLLSSLLFAFSVTIDSFVVGVAYGIKKIRISLLSNFLIALISSFGTFLAMSVGLLIAALMPSAIGNALGGIILIVIGLLSILDYFKKRCEKRKEDIDDAADLIGCTDILDNPEKADADSSGDIDTKEAVTLAFALTINNLIVGIGASISALNIIFTTFCTFVLSIVMIAFGGLIGRHYLTKALGEYALLVSGIIIIALGLYEIFI
ncbi:sporulation membrane protein YtaF [Mahella sp.]|jgi:putative sporulation protein YtaF|uniref:sporulation membrane protein YtaF n=1 Tax=Mahella sp. TaxID=2798721 RepID=UPI0024ABEE29|nr:sporulation membrane protein YtaF [Mahella sp.]MBZ4666479.1 sporulation protein YtaF [Mahella sp.]MDI3508340.1 hypothetical protein [Clostridiales bacterium]MDK2902622.1 hypothetical protein [Clostridiales bacterium]MDK2991187.1 hypothetical protein [Clostridiales bacterium]